ncbi:hypothetical protein BH20ACT24_BH20ACT24_12580 [soil metagenome]
MLGELEESEGRFVVADLEAGVGTISRLRGSDVDRLIVVVEPYAKSIETARRALKVAREVGIESVVLVANRSTGEEDIAVIAQAFPEEQVFSIPEDPVVIDADRTGTAPIDAEPASPAVAAIEGIAADLIRSSERGGRVAAARPRSSGRLVTLQARPLPD